MKQVRYIFFVLCLFTSGMVSAQQSLSLTQCRQMALENNKQIAIAGRDKERADLITEAARTNYLPRLSAEGSALFSRSDTKMNLQIGDLPPMDFDLDINRIYMADLSIEQPLYTGGKITSGYKISQIGSDIAELNEALTEDEVLLETDNAYWTCVQAGELQRSTLQYKETVEEFYRVVKNACDAGMKSQNDLMKVQVQLNRADLQLHRAENGVRLSRMNLCNIIGLDLQSEISLSETFTESHIGINPDANIFSRPESSLLDKQVELKQYEKQYVRSDFLPQIGIMGSYGYIHGAKFNGEQIFGNKPSFSAMVSIKVPLFSWGEGTKRVKAVEREIQMAQLQRDDVGEKMKLELQQAINSYNEALLEVRLTQKAQGQSEENLRVSRDNYDVGMETISDYLEAQTIWRNAQAEHIMAKTKLEIRKTEYLKASGNL
ncbi:MAG: TolC family protein [Proteiniphilum sp.]